MARHTDFDLSELERELESDTDSEFESDEDELSDYEAEAGDESELEFEGEFEVENELESGDFEADEEYESGYGRFAGEASDYGERLFEISEREFESPGSMDTALHEVLNEMGRDYFLGRAWKRLKRGVPGLKKLVRTGMKLANRAGIKIPVLSSLKNMGGLAQSLLQGNLAGIAKHALSAAASAHPGAAAAMPVLKALGFETDEPEARRRAWHNFAEVAREAYEGLADSLNETAHQPGQAMQLAQAALHQALRKAPARARSQGVGGAAGSAVERRGRVRVVRLAPGEKLVVVGRRPRS